MMTPEERDALIDATVDQCCMIARDYSDEEAILEAGANVRIAREVGRLIAAAIRAEFKK